MTTSRVFLSSGLLITGILILLYTNGTGDLNYVVERETTKDFELKTSKRSKSIGFLRKSNIYVRIFGLTVSRACRIFLYFYCNEK